MVDTGRRYASGSALESREVVVVVVVVRRERERATHVNGYELRRERRARLAYAWARKGARRERGREIGNKPNTAPYLSQFV